MATEQGTAGQLRNGWRMAKVGFWWGVFAIAIEAVGLLFGDTPDWRGRAIALPVLIVFFAVGGVLYSLLLPSPVRRRPGPATWARTRTGALAGAVTVLPVAVPVGVLAGAPITAILVLAAAVIGATVALVAALSRPRPEARGAAGGIGESPRLAGRP
jgi:hypothetical protein